MMRRLVEADPQALFRDPEREQALIDFTRYGNEAVYDALHAIRTHLSPPDSGFGRCATADETEWVHTQAFSQALAIPAGRSACAWRFSVDAYAPACATSAAALPLDIAATLASLPSQEPLAGEGRTRASY